MNQTKPIRINRFDRNIRKLRQKLSLTQQQLADILDEKRGTISAWETGRGEPCLDKLIVITERLKIDDSYLLIA